jgi:predicted glycosyltransferase
VIVERARPDFRALLRIARASISQAGYNTVMDLLCAGTPCVLVPFATGEQTEQAFRAQRLEALGLAVVLAEADLTPENLAQALERSLALPKGGATFDMDGARASARLISAWLDGHGDHEVSAQ